jgi:hypothetical protein
MKIIVTFQIMSHAEVPQGKLGFLFSQTFIITEKRVKMVANVVFESYVSAKKVTKLVFILEIFLYHKALEEIFKNLFVAHKKSLKFTEFVATK